MTITYTDKNWKAVADEGRALCKAEENGPTTITTVRAPLNVPTSTWKDCDYGTPPEPEPPESAAST